VTPAAGDEVAQKLSAARAWLVIDKPFLGALVLRLPPIEADARWCPTTATDARSFYYNRAYLQSLSLEQTKFILAHEALHCALSHFARRQHRVKRRWDIACDYAVNPLLLGDGLRPPPRALMRAAFEGMTAEEIYPYIKDTDSDETLDRHVYDDDAGADPSTHEGSHRAGGGAANQSNGDKPPRDDDGGRGSLGKPPQADTAAAAPPPLTPAERDALATQWQQRLAAAAQQALRAGKLAGSLARLVDRLLQPQLPWRALLARYMTSAARTDYSFMRASRREGAAILPSLHSRHIDVAVVVDTSGSINAQELQEFVSELDAIKGSIGARITLHACDAALAADGPWIYEPWDELRLPKHLSGGGGTSFRPAFAWAEGLERQPDLLLYFTDASGEFPPHPPRFPVLWLVKGKGDVPWGQRVQLN